MTAVLQALAAGWHVEVVPILAAVVAGGLYLRGVRLMGPSGRPHRLEIASFLAGLAAILAALLSPLDDLAAQLQWAHMTQHLLLLLVAPPLVVLGRPLTTALHGLPPGASAFLSRVLDRRLSEGAAPTLVLTGACMLFTATMWAWHLPRLYDATLSTQAVHDLEHTTFLAAGILFWAVVAGRVAGVPNFGHVARAAACLSGLITSWMLAVYIGYSPAVLYTYPGGYGLTALADQQIAAGVMWIPGSVPFLVALTALLAHWLEADDRAGVADAARRTGVVG